MLKSPPIDWWATAPRSPQPASRSTRPSRKRRNPRRGWLVPGLCLGQHRLGRGQRGQVEQVYQHFTRQAHPDVLGIEGRLQGESRSQRLDDDRHVAGLEWSFVAILAIARGDEELADFCSGPLVLLTDQ